ncbi:MAG: hypothetical protein SGILL_001892, partial [Bacillariaceae sp.]
MRDDEDEATLDRKEGLKTSQMKMKGYFADFPLKDGDEKDMVLSSANRSRGEKGSTPTPTKENARRTSGRNPISSFKSFKTRWPGKRSQSKSNRTGFAVELQQAHQRRQLKQRLLPESEEKKDDSQVFNKQQAEESEYYPPKAMSIFEDSEDGIRAQLKLEKLKNLAWKDKLDETEEQLRGIRETQSNEFVDQYTAQIRQLQEEVSHYKSLCKDESHKRETAEKELEKQNDRFRVLMFQEIPTYSPHFGDI